MAANEIHIGDIGTVFEVTLKDGVDIVDISGATVLQIIFEKPDKTIITNTAVLSSGGVDGKMKYTISLASELDIKGNWKIQGKVTLPTGSWSTDIDKFKVYENLE